MLDSMGVRVTLASHTLPAQSPRHRSGCISRSSPPHIPLFSLCPPSSLHPPLPSTHPLPSPRSPSTLPSPSAHQLPPSLSNLPVLTLSSLTFPPTPSLRSGPGTGAAASSGRQGSPSFPPALPHPPISTPITPFPFHPLLSHAPLPSHPSHTFPSQLPRHRSGCKYRPPAWRYA